MSNATRSGRIAFQGEPGANSEIACKEAYPAMEPVACATFEDAFAAVRDADAELGMIPIENSLGGRVADIHHLLPDSRLAIIDEHFQAVKYCLLAPEPATLEGLQHVLSHPQALAQCRSLIAELGLTAHAAADTAGAAREVSERNDPSWAALSSEIAGEYNKLKVLRRRVEDRLGNTTRFIVMSRRREDPDYHDVDCMTSLVFSVRSVPAALYKGLGGFATNGVNITKLESYITDSSFTVAQFYAELEGHPAMPNVARAMEELQYFSTRLTVLGSYPRSSFRN